MDWPPRVGFSSLLVTCLGLLGSRMVRPALSVRPAKHAQHLQCISSLIVDTRIHTNTHKDTQSTSATTTVVTQRLSVLALDFFFIFSSFLHHISILDFS
uniref:Putative secreted protein n=1 Tax=Anopheles triannulatus TaxID=58253 RepID=A0A2M4B3U5_9DIPT